MYRFKIGDFYFYVKSYDHNIYIRLEDFKDYIIDLVEPTKLITLDSIEFMHSDIIFKDELILNCNSLQNSRFVKYDDFKEHLSFYFEKINITDKLPNPSYIVRSQYGTIITLNSQAEIVYEILKKIKYTEKPLIKLIEYIVENNFYVINKDYELKLMRGEVSSISQFVRKIINNDSFFELYKKENKKDTHKSYWIRKKEKQLIPIKKNNINIPNKKAKEFINLFFNNLDEQETLLLEKILEDKINLNNRINKLHEEYEESYLALKNLVMNNQQGGVALCNN